MDKLGGEKKKNKRIKRENKNKRATPIGGGVILPRPPYLN